MTHDEMDRLTAGIATKAARVRTLNEAGVATSAIATYLGIRYQHVYNVLLRSGAIQKGEKSDVAASAVLDRDAEIIVGRISENGGIELPREVLDRYGLAPGAPVFCRPLPDGIVVLSLEAARRAATEAVREKMPGQAALIEALFDPSVLQGQGKPSPGS